MTKFKTLASGALGLALATLSLPALAQDAPEAQAIARAAAEKAQAEALTAMYNSRKAQADAEAAAAAAKLGPLSTYKMEGNVDVGTNSGKLEATLLASEATRISASRIVDRLCPLLATNGRTACGDDIQGSPLIVFTDTEKPSFDAYDAFSAQLRSIKTQLLRVKGRRPVVRPATGGPISGSTIGLAGVTTLLSTAGNLLRSDYKLSYVDVTADDVVLVRALLEQAKAKKLGSAISVPLLYGGRINYDTNPAILSLDAVEQDRNIVAGEARGLREESATQPKNKAALEALAVEMEDAVKRFDAFALRLGTADDKGVVPLSVIARQAAVSQALTANGHMLVLKVNLAGGSAYSQKNFWTFLGTMPFSVSGGSLISYTLLKGQNGEVVDAGVLAQTQPFTRIHRATQRFLKGSR